MAYYIFSKILEDPKKLGKIVTSKILINLLVQFPKPCKFKKILFYSERNFPYLSTQQPTSPLSLLAHPMSFFLLPHQSRAHKPPPPAGLAPPPWPPPTTSVEEKKVTASPLLHFPIIRRPLPSSILR
jgi:hypothetical protein